AAPRDAEALVRTASRPRARHRAWFRGSRLTRKRQPGKSLRARQAPGPFYSSFLSAQKSGCLRTAFRAKLLQEADEAPSRRCPLSLGATQVLPPLVPRRVRIGADLTPATVPGVR